MIPRDVCLFFSLLIFVVIFVKIILDINTLIKKRGEKDFSLINLNERFSIGSILTMGSGLFIIICFFVSWFNDSSGLDFALGNVTWFEGGFSLLLLIPILALLIIFFAATESKKLVVRYNYITLTILLLFEGYSLALLGAGQYGEDLELLLFVFHANIGYWLVIAGIVVVLIGGKTIEKPSSKYGEETKEKLDSLTGEEESSDLTSQEETQSEVDRMEEDEETVSRLASALDTLTSLFKKQEDEKFSYQPPYAPKEESKDSKINAQSSDTERKEKLESEMENLREEEDMIDTREIEKAMENDDLDRAEEELEELKEKYQEYKETIEELENLDDRLSSLSKKLADDEIDSQIYKDAKKGIESEKFELEEKVEELRKDVIHEDYEKPF